MHKVGYRPAPSAFVLLLQEIVSQLLIGNDYAKSSITKTYFLILFRSLSHPCAEDKASFNLILRLSHALNLVPRAFVTAVRERGPALLEKAAEIEPIFTAVVKHKI